MFNLTGAWKRHAAVALLPLRRVQFWSERPSLKDARRGDAAAPSPRADRDPSPS